MVTSQKCRVAISCAAILLASNVIDAKAAGRWSSLATSPSPDGKLAYGFAQNHISEAKADSVAIQRCRQNKGSNCKVVFRNTEKGCKSHTIRRGDKSKSIKLCNKR